MKKQQQILISSLYLFNKKGINEVSTNLVCDYMDISPGNLYYYYKNKMNIIESLVEQLINEITLSLNLSKDIDNKNPNAIAFFLKEFFIIMWKYRFFYRNLSEILLKSPLSKNLYETFKLKVYKYLKRLINALIKNNFLLNIKKDMKEFIDVIQLFTTFWIPNELLVKHNELLSIKTAYIGMDKFINNFNFIATPEGLQLISCIKLELALYCENDLLKGTH